MGAWFVVSLAASIGLVYFNGEYVYEVILKPAKNEYLILIASQLPYFVGALAVIGGFTYMAKVGIDTYKEVREDVSDEVEILLYIASFFVALYVFSLGYMYFVHSAFENAEGFLEHIFFAILSLIGVLFTLYILIGGLFLCVIIPTFFIFFTPFVVLSVYGFFATGETQTTEIARKHASSKRPDDEILKELSKAMKTGMASDTELHKIVHELSPIRRFFTELSYKREVEKYREVRKILDEEAKAIDARADIAESSLKLELGRRDD